MLYPSVSYLHYTLQQKEQVQEVKGGNVTLFTALLVNHMRDLLVNSVLCKNEESADFCCKE